VNEVKEREREREKEGEGKKERRMILNREKK